MMRKILPLLLAFLGLGGGVAAGIVLRPAADTEHPEEHHEPEAEETPVEPEYVKLNNQFVVPVIEGGRVSAMVVLSLSLEVTTGSTEAIYSREPKLQDAFLQVLFDHANVGGFRGSFTDGSNLVVLRTSLREAAVAVAGEVVKDVLITGIARQDN
ncbi:MAG: flagellar basal body-associated protein FliL [Tabrizicola sp.]|nr:flagellar basal body-associated protein FliL [Tabrizicola sp.]